MPAKQPLVPQKPHSETPPTDLSTKQVLALQALLLHHSVKEAAQAAHVGETTIYRWLSEDDDFRIVYWKACRRLLDQAIGLLHTRTAQAVNTLHEISQDKQAPYSSRIAASCALIGLSFKGISHFAAEESKFRQQEATLCAIRSEKENLL